MYLSVTYESNGISFINQMLRVMLYEVRCRIYKAGSE